MLLTEPTAGAGSRSSEADRWDVGTETISLDLSWCPSPTVHEGRLHVPGAPAALRTSNMMWIARLDAHRWTLLPQPIQGRVNAAFSWRGWLVIAGSFESAGEVRDESIAWWHEGTWKPFPAPKGKSLQGRVELIAGSETESLVVAGRTLKIGGVDSPGVVRWHGEWLPAGGGLAMATNTSLQALATAPGDQVYLLVEEFQPVRKCVLRHLRGWGTWREIPGPKRMDHLAITPDGSVYVGGQFGPPWVPEVTPLARWDRNGWQGVGPPLSHPGGPEVGRGLMYVDVRALGVWGNDLVVGGGFRRAGDIEANLIARWDGQSWHAFGTGLGTLGLNHLDGRRPVYYERHSPRMFAGSPNTLFVLGGFDRAGDQAVRGLASWYGERWINPVRSPPMEVNGPIAGLALSSNRLYAVGGFSVAGDVAAPGIAVWHDESWSGLGWVPASGLHAGIRRPMVADGPFVWLSAEATGTNPAPWVSDLVRWDGEQWHRLTNCLVLGGRTAIAAHQGAVYFHGKGIQRWNGTDLTDVAPAPVSPYSASRLVFLPDGRLCALLGGFAHRTGSRLRRDLYRSQVVVFDNGDWNSLDGGELGGDQLPTGLVVGDTLYVGADFPGLVARWRAGSGWQRLGLPDRTDFWHQSEAVYALACWRGQLFAGGRFSQMAGLTVNNIARWDGNRWHAMGEGVHGDVNALAVMGNYLYVGGRFDRVDGKPAANFARWRIE